MAARTCPAVFRIKCGLSSPRVEHIAKSFISSRHFCTSAKVRKTIFSTYRSMLPEKNICSASESALSSKNNQYVMSLIIFHKSTVDEEEIEKLSRTISDWWNPNGDFAALHSMNKLRVPFIKSSLEHLLGENVIPSKPLKDFRILDVGCGGGILSEVRVL